MYKLNTNVGNIGGYLSSEQIDLLSIIQCQTEEELQAFVEKCEQLKSITLSVNQPLEQLKRSVFKLYQDTLVFHNSDNFTSTLNKLKLLNISDEDIENIKKANSIEYCLEYIKNRYPEEIFIRAHHLISLERDQNKDPNLYDELELLNRSLGNFNTLLIGSLKPEIVINEYSKTKKFDFYFAERDLDFAFKNNKHVRFHSLLTKNVCEELFDGKTKSEIIAIMKDYVKASIDFIKEYNEKHTLADGLPVINSVDLFNEIVSFDKNDFGEYENIWESKYGITIKDIAEIFEYAKENKPEEVSYIYNEPFLEDEDRRKKVFQVLQEFNRESEGLIDTLGSQMHITFSTPNDQIKECFKDFKKLQDDYGLGIQITEFDLSLSKQNVETLMKKTIPFEQIYKMKEEKIKEISQIIKASSVMLSGVSYWSLTDRIDSNLERIRDNLLKKGIISDISQFPTAFGGLISTSLQSINLQQDDAYYNDLNSAIESLSENKFNINDLLNEREINGKSEQVLSDFGIDLFTIFLNIKARVKIKYGIDLENINDIAKYPDIVAEVIEELERLQNERKNNCQISR